MSSSSTNLEILEIVEILEIFKVASVFFLIFDKHFWKKPKAQNAQFAH